MNITIGAAARTAVRGLAILFASLALVATAQAQGHHSGGGFRGGHGGGHFVHDGRNGFGHGHRGAGLVWGGLGLGIGLGLGGYYGWPWYPAGPGYVLVEPPVVYYDSQPVPAVNPPASAHAAPDPVIYPRNGQSAAQTEADRQECGRWATTQPSAMADASVFQRATAACMDARGYTLR